MKPVKISDRKLKKFERDVTILVNELFKQQRGLTTLYPGIQINFYRSDTPEQANLFDKFDYETNGTYTSGTVWKWIEYGRTKITLFRK
jgi:hypothetical protein